MNWNKIKEKYPKAWGKFDSSIYELRILNDTLYCKIWGQDDWEQYELRDFYDFFDKQGIWIETTTPCLNKRVFLADINTSTDSYMVEGSFKTRIEAEEKAFEKAFEILEGIL